MTATIFLNESRRPLAHREDALIVYPHAQRTGGVTLRKRVLAQAYGEKQVYSPHYVENAKDWDELSESDLDGYRAYVDIFNYSDNRFRRPCLFIASLRHPLYRAISIYFYVKRKDGHSQRELANRTTMEEFYRQASDEKPKYHRNVQCMRICGRHDAQFAHELIRKTYIGVGRLDALADFVRALGGVFGWPEISLKPVAPDSERYDKLVTPAYRDMVLDENREDLKLFEMLTNGRM